MPTLGNALDFSKYEGKQFRAHQLGSAPGSPVTGQLFYNTADNTLYWWDGSAWVSARGGVSTTPPATTGALGTVQLAGDLAGTATSPQIAAGVITDAEVATANKDGAVGTASMRTVGTGAQQAMAGATKLNQVPAPNGPVDLGNNKITTLATPTQATDAATMAYVDSVAQGLDAKQSVEVASTGNLTLSGVGQTIDGQTLPGTAQRVLVKDQSTPSQNGIYITAVGAWIRTFDFDAWADVPGAFVFVERGTVNGDTGWVCTSDLGGTLGTTAITWAQFSGAGSIVGGAGLTKTGNTLDVGAGNGLSVLADTVNVASGGITDGMIAAGNLDPNKLMSAVPVTKGGTGQATAKAGRETGLGGAGYYSSATHAATAQITIPQSTHGLRSSRGLLVQVQDEASGAVEIADVVVLSNGDLQVTFGTTVASNSKRVTVIG